MDVDVIVTALLGPIGILLGWWLNQRGTQSMADRAAEQASRAEERERVLRTIRLGRRTASLVRDLLHAMYLKGTTGSKPAGLLEMIDEYNRTRDDYQDAVLAMRLLGPSWPVADAEQLDMAVGRMGELAFKMQSNLLAEYVDSSNTELPLLDQQVAAFVAKVAQRYNDGATDLPDPPNYEKEARWRKPVSD